MDASVSPIFATFVIFRLPTSMSFTKDAVGMLSVLFFSTLMDVLFVAVEVTCAAALSVTEYVPVGRLEITAFPSAIVTVASLLLAAETSPFVMVIVTVFADTGVSSVGPETVKV